MTKAPQDAKAGLQQTIPSHILVSDGLTPQQDIKTQRIIDDTTLIGSKIMMRKCVNDHIRDDDGEILIALTDQMIDGVDQGFDVPFFYEVVKVGGKCKMVSQADLDAMQLFMYVESRFQMGIHSVTSDLIVVDENILNGANPPIKPFFYEEAK
jgi:hypothetical protein